MVEQLSRDDFPIYVTAGDPPGGLFTGLQLTTKYASGAARLTYAEVGELMNLLSKWRMRIACEKIGAEMPSITWESCGTCGGSSGIYYREEAGGEILYTRWEGTHSTEGCCSLLIRPLDDTVYCLDCQLPTTVTD